MKYTKYINYRYLIPFVLLLALVIILLIPKNKNKVKSVIEHINVIWIKEDKNEINKHIKNNMETVLIYKNDLRKKDISNKSIDMIDSMIKLKEIKYVEHKRISKPEENQNTKDHETVWNKLKKYLKEIGNKEKYYKVKSEIQYVSLIDIDETITNKINNMNLASNARGDIIEEINKYIQEVYKSIENKKSDKNNDFIKNEIIYFTLKYTGEDEWQIINEMNDYKYSSSESGIVHTPIKDMSLLEVKLLSDIPYIKFRNNSEQSIITDNVIKEPSLLDEKYIEDLEKSNSEFNIQNPDILIQINNELKRQNNNIITNNSYVENGSKFTGKKYENIDNFNVKINKGNHDISDILDLE